MPTALDRRSFLLGAGAVLFSPPARAIDQALRFASAYRDPSGQFGLAILNEMGEILSTHSLPARGHGVTAHPETGKAVIFARRPDNFALAFDPSGQEHPALFHTPDNRHFYGHGTFSADGRLLYATENDFDNVRGVIGVYDVLDHFKRLGEFPSGGIGPHEIIPLPGQNILVVANGGIETHPDFPRAKLNLNSMKSNIAFIDMRHGDVIETHELPEQWQRLSLRHMAAGEGGKVWIGGQYEGAGLDHAPLIANVSLTDPLSFADIGSENYRGLRNYVGSVAISQDGECVGFTSPKGGEMLILNAKTGALVDVQRQEAVCGLASGAKRFVSSTENGAFGARQHDVNWDNHIAAIELNSATVSRSEAINSVK